MLQDVRYDYRTELTGNRNRYGSQNESKFYSLTYVTTSPKCRLQTHYIRACKGAEFFKFYIKILCNKLCAWWHDMPTPLSSPGGRPSASRVAGQTQRSSSFPRPIRSPGHRGTCLTR